MEKTILILGGDGYLGWPLAMRMAAQHPEDKVIIVDNEWRRGVVDKLGYKSAVPIAPASVRIDTFRELHGLSNLMYIKADINSDKLEEIIRIEKPYVIYHLAQQPSAPYSMKGVNEAVFTIQNNGAGNMRLLWAVKRYAPHAHIVKMGSFGQYAKTGVDIPEGHFMLEHNGMKAGKPLLFPREADDIYHISKINDSDYIAMACRKWGLRVTDVMQSIIFGNLTAEMQGNTALHTRFDYDEVFGTVLNRFLAQVVSGNPLTIYGTGQQRTGLMSLRDVVASLARFTSDIPEAGTHRVVNHLTETSYSINELAEEIKTIAEERNYKVRINREYDPRMETEEDKQQYSIATDYIDRHIDKTCFIEVIKETFTLLSRYCSHIVDDSFAPKIWWDGHHETGKKFISSATISSGGISDIYDAEYWDAFRRIYFPSPHINLNTGTLGTISVPVMNARTMEHNGASLKAFPLGTYQDARHRQEEILFLCHELWPAKDYHCAVTPSISQTVNLLSLAMLRVFYKDVSMPVSVLSTTHEHHGGIGAFAHLPEYHVHYLEEEQFEEEKLRARVRELQPKVVFFSHVFYDTCIVNPVNDWARIIKQEAPDCKIIIDAAQSLGLYALPVGYADVVVSSTHKWLFGPHGGGLMWIKEEFLQWVEGLYWTSNHNRTNGVIDSMLIQGGQDFQLHAAILEALKLYRQIGADIVFSRSAHLAAMFRSKVTDVFRTYHISFRLLSSEGDTPALSIAFTDYDPYPLYNYLNEHNIHLKCIKDHKVGDIQYHILRVSLPYFETESRLNFAVSEIDYFLSQQNGNC